jgi:hypothetical protein
VAELVRSDELAVWSEVALTRGSRHRACLGEVLSAEWMALIVRVSSGDTNHRPASVSVTVCVLSCLCLRAPRRVPARAVDARMPVGACECILPCVGETRRVDWHAPSRRRDLPVELQ